MPDGFIDSTGDEAAIGQVLMALGGAFRELDADAAAPLYTDDADWVNAFGTRVDGRNEIVAYLRTLFADERFAAGKPVGPPQASIRFIADDVAVARTYIEREGQRTVEGETLPVRRNHSMKVLVKRDGRWLIASDIYMDARDEQTLASE
jgi:uncharacterized protein (TIGR02246 family)